MLDSIFRGLEASKKGGASALNRMMDAKERDRLIRLLNNPPPGSKLAAAKEYGIDLTLLVHNLELTPGERIRELIAAQTLLDELRRASIRS